MANTSKKIFVLDTNVILHDATCIQNFEDNEVVIPISALEELDQFKRGNEQIHYNAREFLRLLDELSIDSNSNELNQPDGKIKVVVNHNWHPDVEKTFKEDCPDTRNSKVVNLINEIKSFRSKVDVYDPVANKNEIRKEFDIDLIDNPIVNTYELVVIAVGHQFFKNLGGKKIRNFCKKNGIVFDLKNTIPKNETDYSL